MEIKLEKGIRFSTGFGLFVISEIKNDVIYATRCEKNCSDFKPNYFTKDEVISYIKYQ